MERLKQMDLKKSFFCITLIFLLIAITLSALVFLGCILIQKAITTTVTIEIGDNAVVSNLKTISNDSLNVWNTVVNILQLVLPVIFIIVALLAADIVFYHIKLKHPLVTLQAGAERIMQNDLDFTVSQYSSDELGRLCSTFETMRCELLKSKKELWWQAEERKRLNAAFSHDLRNPVTVLKGAVKVLQKGFLSGQITSQNIQDTLTLMDEYIKRIEVYVEAMSSSQRLEELQCTLKATQWNTFTREFCDSVHLLTEGTGIEVLVNLEEQNNTIWIDKAIVFNVAENLISNAIRYAKAKIDIHIFLHNHEMILSVQDDGVGFSQKILKIGTEPFLKGDETDTHSKHLGMGLYICRLMCEKHGGTLDLQNNITGALTIVKFNICKP